AQEAGREHGQDSWPETARGTFHSTDYQTQYVHKLERVGWKPSDCCWGTGWALISR
ncbi:hypothetical protein HGM15179_000498, partial [Zosterops borbonicus]